MFAGESWSFIHNDSTDETEPFHYWTAMLDSQALAFKIWYFEPNSSFYTVPSGADTIALTSLFAQWVNGASYFTLEKLYGYTTDQLGQPYTQAVVNMPDLGEKSGLPDTTTTQTLDIYGNLTQMNVFDYGNTSGTPTRTYNLTYLNVLGNAGLGHYRLLDQFAVGQFRHYRRRRRAPTISPTSTARPTRRCTSATGLPRPRSPPARELQLWLRTVTTVIHRCNPATPPICGTRIT